AYKGLPHDVFCFTMLQEMIATRLNKDLGVYRQFVGSMHLYEDDFVDSQQYLDEGYHKAVEMPPMPAGNPLALVPSLLDAERKIRAGADLAASSVFGYPYWADIVRLIQVFWATGDADRLNLLKTQFASPIYKAYLEGRMSMPRRVADKKTQPDFG